MKKEISNKAQMTEFLLYTTPTGAVKVETLLHDESLWLTQKRIAELFGVQRPAVTKHLSNIFQEGELQEPSVSSILEHTADDGIPVYSVTLNDGLVPRNSLDRHMKNDAAASDNLKAVPGNLV